MVKALVELTKRTEIDRRAAVKRTELSGMNEAIAAIGGSCMRFC